MKDQIGVVCETFFSQAVKREHWKESLLHRLRPRTSRILKSDVHVEKSEYPPPPFWLFSTTTILIAFINFQENDDNLQRP